MGRFRWFVTYLLPLGAVMSCIGLLYLVPNARTAVEAIDKSVQAICAKAGTYEKDACIDSLILLLESTETPFETKNEAVWALGQLAAPRALPVLHSLQTGKPCQEPCRRDQAVCQREVEKAIRWCRGEAWLMRGLRRFFGARR